MVTRLTKGRENTELIDTVASLPEATRRIFQVDFHHVRAHTDIYGNEAADRLAGRGAAGRISPHAYAWTEHFAGPMGTPPPPQPPEDPLDKVCDALRRLRVLGEAVGRFWNATLVENLSVHAICHSINLIVAVQTPQTGSANTVTTHLLFLSKVGRITKDIPILPKLSEMVSLLNYLSVVPEDRPLISHIHTRTPPHPYHLPPHPPQKKGVPFGTCVISRSHDEHQSSILLCALPPGNPMARQPRGNAQDPARKRRLDEFDRRLTAVEGQVRTHEDRMENLEYRFELETSYRYIRIENSPGLDQMFKDLAAKTMENSEIRERTGQVLMREIREVLEREVDEGELSATSQTSNARRKWHPPYGRQHLTHLIWHLWWIYALGLGIIAATCACNKGNPHAWLSPQSRMCLIGLCIFTHSTPLGDQYKLQVFPDRGPAVCRRKGYGKGKEGKGKDGKGKGGKGKGKGKGKAGGNQEG